MAASRVALVLDPAIGEGLALLDPPLWVCDSSVNRPVAERLRSIGDFDPRGVTVITALRPTAEETFADVIETRGSGPRTEGARRERGGSCRSGS
jgi:hypothetical protein